MTEYNKIIGSLTILWEGEERTFWQMYGLLYEPDRSVRQRAWEAAEAELARVRQNINELWERFMPVRRQIARNSGNAGYSRSTSAAFSGNHFPQCGRAENSSAMLRARNEAIA